MRVSTTPPRSASTSMRGAADLDDHRDVADRHAREAAPAADALLAASPARLDGSSGAIGRLSSTRQRTRTHSVDP